MNHILTIHSFSLYDFQNWTEYLHSLLTFQKERGVIMLPLHQAVLSFQLPLLHLSFLNSEQKVQVWVFNLFPMEINWIPILSDRNRRC